MKKNEEKEIRKRNEEKDHFTLLHSIQIAGASEKKKIFI